jgi:uroporphyrinogen-III synthase
VTYRNILGSPSHPGVDRVRAGSFDVVTFASASAVRAFVDLVGHPADLGLGRDTESGLLNVGCIGPQTAAAAADAGFRVDIVASEHTGGGLRDALITHFSGGPGSEAESGEPHESEEEAAQGDGGTMLQ